MIKIVGVKESGLPPLTALNFKPSLHPNLLYLFLGPDQGDLLDLSREEATT